MNNERNSLTIAYIAFLILSALIYVASIILKFEYVVWKQIIAAATVASYCFSLTGVFKAQVIICKNVILGCENLIPLSAKQDEIFKKTLQKLRSDDEKKASEIESKAKNLSVVKETKDIIDYNSSKIKKFEQCIFVSNALGYFLFFCIVVFETIYNKIMTSQEFLTLLAFILMLLSDYISESISKKYSKRFENLCFDIQNNINILNEAYDTRQEKTYNEKCI